MLNDSQRSTDDVEARGLLARLKQLTIIPFLYEDAPKPAYALVGFVYVASGQERLRGE
ncbi:MAG: hypothetical protein ACHBN1_03705 [Heteroscytonema crispum UTEX LB 1556]